MALTKRTATGLKSIASRRVLVPKPSPKRFFGHGIPGVDPERLCGKLVVIEGADGSGRSTQIARLVQWLEGCGHATVQVGLKRDRKSTRLNSSHGSISYAVFCLKKK